MFVLLSAHYNELYFTIAVKTSRSEEGGRIWKWKMCCIASGLISSCSEGHDTANIMEKDKGTVIILMLSNRFNADMQMLESHFQMFNTACLFLLEF